MIDGIESHWQIKKTKDGCDQWSFGPISGPETWLKGVRMQNVAYRLGKKHKNKTGAIMAELNQDKVQKQNKTPIFAVPLQRHHNDIDKSLKKIKDWEQLAWAEQEDAQGNSELWLKLWL